MDLRKFAAGSIAGCAGQVVGHPLDSIKVVMQARATESVAFPAAPKREETGLASASRMYQARRGSFRRAFLRGLSVPLAAKAAEQCAAFGLRQNACAALEGMGLGGSGAAFASGAVAGAGTALLMTPVYLIKVQLQATSVVSSAGSRGARAPAVPDLQGPLDAVQETMARRGGSIAGLWTGAAPTLVGTTVGYACRFATYDAAVALCRDDLEWGRVASSVVGGGLAGVATWVSHYPIDLVATRMMTDVVLRGSEKRRGMRWYLRSIYKSKGPRGFFRGLGPCLLRAFPVNAAIFVTYEAVIERI